MTFIRCFLLCCTTISHPPGTTWETSDNVVLDKARVRCEQLYKQSPCLTKLTKVDSETYRAQCGRNNQ